MKEKIINAILLMAAVTAFVACSSDDKLSDPAGRTQEAVGQYKNILAAAPNGWVMGMYGDTDFGGVNVLLKFDTNGQVTVANEKFIDKYGAGKTEDTHYKFEQSNGIILSFDQYCELFHYFSDPVNADGYRSSTRNGFGGDLEFRVISVSAEKVVMQGKKHGERIVMTPMPGGLTWADYLTQVQAVSKTLQKGSYKVKAGDQELTMRANKRNRVFTYVTTDDSGSRVTHTLPYLITPQGIVFYEPFSYSGHQVEGFTYVAGADSYPQSNGGDVVLEKFTPALNQQLVDGVWYITKDGLGTYATNFWNQFRQGLLNGPQNSDEKYNCIIYYAVFGTWRNNFGLSVGPVDKDNPSAVYLAECYFDYELIGEDQIKMWFNGTFDEIGNGETFYPNSGARMQYAVLPFGQSKSNPRTFRIETDNEKDPTYLRLVDTSMGINVITLQAEETLYPFGDNVQQ